MSNYNKYPGLSTAENWTLFRGQLNGISPELINNMAKANRSNIEIPKINFGNINLSSGSDTYTKNLTLGKEEPLPIPEIKSTGATKTTAEEKVANSKFGKFMGKYGEAIGAANGLAKAAGAFFHSNRTGLQKTDEGALKLRDGQYSVLKKIPVTAPFAQAAEFLDNTLGAITGGLGSATKADKILTAIPLMGNTAAIFAGKTDTFKGDIQDINTGDFGGTMADATRAQELSGVKSVAKNKLNRQIRSAQFDFNRAAEAVDYNRLRKNNNIGQDLQSAMLSKYQGGNQSLTLAKNGIKFPDLENARNILNSKSKDIQSFKSGGKIEKENIIPTGALHKNLHHIEDIGIDITKKGIPVVTMDEGGEFKEQIAEVEAAEWTLSLNVTKQIEEYHENYKETGDDNIAIECGKFLVDQIFNNTRDDDKVIKKTE